MVRPKKTKTTTGRRKPTNKKSDPDKEISKKNKGRKEEERQKKRDECDHPDKCGTPRVRPGSHGAYYADILEDCRNIPADKSCHYLCHPGYDEDPHALICRDHGQNDKRWNTDAHCVPQECEHSRFGQTTYIKVKASRWGSDIFSTYRRGRDAVLFVVLFDESEKLPIHSTAYHNFPVQVKLDERADYFRQHPCAHLSVNQAKNSDYSNNPLPNNPHRMSISLLMSI